MRRAAIAAAVGLLLAWPAAAQAAELGSLEASAILAQGGTDVAGRLAMLQVASNGDAASRYAVSVLDITAAHVQVDQYTNEGLETALPNPLTGGEVRASTVRLTESSPALRSAPESFEAEPASLALKGMQDAYLLNLWSAAGVDFAGHVAGAQAAPLLDPVMGYGFLLPADAAPAPGGAPFFSTYRADGPHVGLVATGRAATLTLTGDFILEVSGATFILSDATGTRELKSGVETYSLQPGSPEADALHGRRDTFLRIALSGAALEVSLDAAGASASAALGSAAWATPEPLTFEDAVGTLRVGGDEVSLDHERYALAEGADLAIVPQGDALRADLTGTRSEPGGGLLADLPAGVPSGLAILGAAVAAAALAWTLRSRSRTPTLPDVEANLQAGHYRRAARMAGRILRRKPDLEDAHIARAIALSKGGRHARVVAEVTARLGRREPTDGVLHYILGLAYADLGRAAEAKVALREAVRRTPSLAAEAAPHLGPQREGSAYA